MGLAGRGKAEGPAGAGGRPGEGSAACEPHRVTVLKQQRGVSQDSGASGDEDKGEAGGAAVPCGGARDAPAAGRHPAAAASFPLLFLVFIRKYFKDPNGRVSNMTNKY